MICGFKSRHAKNTAADARLELDQEQQEQVIHICWSFLKHGNCVLNFLVLQISMPSRERVAMAK